MRKMYNEVYDVNLSTCNYGFVTEGPKIKSFEFFYEFAIDRVIISKFELSENCNIES